MKKAMSLFAAFATMCGLALVGAGIATAGNANASPAASGNITAVGVCVGTQPQNNYGQLRLSGSVSGLSQSTAYRVEVDGSGTTGATTGTRNSDSQGTLDVTGMVVEVDQNAYVAGSSYTWGVFTGNGVTMAATGTLTVQNGNCAPVQPSGSASAVGVYSSLSNGKYQQVQLNLNYKGLKPSTDYGVSIEDSGYNGSVEYTGTTDAQGNLVINGTNTNTRFGVPAGNDLLFIVEKGQGAPTVSTTIDVKAGQPPTTTTVHVKQSSLNQGCGAGNCAVGAHFVITQIGSNAPASIQVTLSDGSTHTVPLMKVSGKTAHYQLSFKPGLKVTDATAVVPSSWSGQFNLSHYLCAPKGLTNPKLSVETQCVPSGGGNAVVDVTNETNATVAKYTVTATQNGKVVDTETASNVAAGATAKVTMSGIQPGVEVVFKVVGSDGTNAEICPTLATCQSQPPVNKVSASCDGIVLDLSGYGASQTENTADIYVDNGLVAEVQFADSYHNTTDVGPYVDTSKHTWKVVVKSSLLPNGEQDYSGTFGPCKSTPPPPKDVCSNLPGVQTTVPAGYVLQNGLCVKPTPPKDVCTNIAGVQTTVPAGYVANDGVCTKKPVAPKDVCSNLAGVQTSVPAGYTMSGGVCTKVATQTGTPQRPVGAATSMGPVQQGFQFTLAELLIVLGTLLVIGGGTGAYIQARRKA